MEKVKVFYTKQCIICLDHSSDTLFEPCSHQCCCKACADTIIGMNMDCPLCRTPIGASGTEFTSSESEPVDDGVLSMWIDCREAYLEKLRGKKSGNAAFAGTSKLARSVNREIGDALIEAQMITQGTDRMGAKKITYSITDGDVFQVTYTPRKKRKSITETYQFVSKDVLISDMDGTEKTTVFDVSVYEPHLYFLFHYHYDGDVEGGMKEANLLETKRRRRRK